MPLRAPWPSAWGCWPRHVQQGEDVPKASSWSSWRRIPPGSFRSRRLPCHRPGTGSGRGDGRGSRDSDEVSDQDAPEPARNAHRGTRHGPRPHRDAQRRQADAQLFSRSIRLCAGPEDFRGDGFGFVAASGRPYGSLRRTPCRRTHVDGDGGQGNRSQAVTDTCSGARRGSSGVDRPAAAIVTGKPIKSVEVVDFPELARELSARSTSRIPPLVIVDDKGNDFFADFKHLIPERYDDTHHNRLLGAPCGVFCAAGNKTAPVFVTSKIVQQSIDITE